MHMIPSAAGLPSCSTDWMVAVCRHAATCGPDGAAGYDWMTRLRSMASDVVKLCGAVGALDTELAASMAVARQKSVASIGRSAVGMKPVSLTPSTLVALVRIVLNVDAVAISNRYVI